MKCQKCEEDNGVRALKKIPSKGDKPILYKPFDLGYDGYSLFLPDGPHHIQISYIDGHWIHFKVMKEER